MTTQSRGYFGIGIYGCKTETNIGTLWRSAYQLGASFIFTVNGRYKKQCSDTVKAWKHIPFYQYETWEQFKLARPKDCKLIGIEFNSDSRPLKNFVHPHNAIYLLGAEDGGLPTSIQKECQALIELPSVRHPSFNVSVAGSIVMFDRFNKTQND